MNSISLSAAAEKKKKPKKFGLTTATNVFGNDDEDDSSSEEEESSKNPVNRELLREQAALRQRAATAMQYDFDGTYQEQKEQETSKKAEPKKESRYIADMMKKAKQRNFERDIAHERKLAKEQEAEDVGDDKEKFITSAYKKKLKERELWKEEQEEEQRRDAERDVKKRKDGVAGFYSNFNRNVAVGGDEAPTEEAKPSFLDGFETAAPTEDSNKDNAAEDDARPSFLDGFEAPNAADDQTIEATGDRKRKLDVTQDDATPKKSMREIRQEKVATARLRYFARRGITEQQALQESY